MGERLGQHFLTSVGAINAIIKAADLKDGETVLEIGPGRGVLTEALLAAGANVVTVEKDDKLCEFLESKVPSTEFRGKLEIICGDILEFDPDYKLKAISYKLIANIPYYITGAIIQKFLEARHPPSKMVLLVQKEVAERIVAKDGKESILSISVKAFGTPKYIQTVKAGSFNPPPKVDSAIIEIENISNNLFGSQKSTVEEQIKEFFETVKRGFASKRKMLKNNLEIPAGTLRACGIDEKARAEELSVEDWGCLVDSSGYRVPRKTNS